MGGIGRGRVREAKALQGGVALILLLMLFICIWALIYVPIPAANKDTFNLIIGGLLNAIGMLTAYFFGTNQSTDFRLSRPKSSEADNA
ncbi:hypothetical protein HBF26_17230 [Luteibacter jiangsuensis]|uniref:Uncharacterized protein n=1 Tax=Luteibacter jiangsuensis TaxID=637577 RepID=A0ABX0Q8E7_9GAMM|nr:hypothetical protein [Luteibacter jiangsuensis]NID06641.1 hypothetical protein [Luteibacter jiangsuensis]